MRPTPFRLILRGTASRHLFRVARAAMLTAPGRFFGLPLPPPGRPSGHSRSVLLRSSWKGRCLCDDRGDGDDDEVLGTRLQRARDDADRRDRAGLFGPEPDGAGAHRVRAVAVAAPQREAEGSRVPGVPRAARRRGDRGAAGQAPGPRHRFGYPCAPDRRRRAGASARRHRARRRAASGRAGACARRAPAVPRAGGTLSLLGAHGPLRRAAALPGVRVAAGPRGGRLPAVLEPGVAHGGARPLGRLGRSDTGRGICSTWSTTVVSCCCRGSR